MWFHGWPLRQPTPPPQGLRPPRGDRWAAPWRASGRDGHRRLEPTFEESPQPLPPSSLSLCVGARGKKTWRPSPPRPPPHRPPVFLPQRRKGAYTGASNSAAPASPPPSRGRQASDSWLRGAGRARTRLLERTNGPRARSQAAARSRCALPPTNIAPLRLWRWSRGLARLGQRWERAVAARPRPRGPGPRRAPAAVLRGPSSAPWREPRPARRRS